jgi:predicted nucleic-acid-binding protein
MKITTDTNLLVRAIAGDDARQSKLAQAELTKADLVAVTLPALCELVWVLSLGYKVPASEIAEAIRRLGAGGDFADGVIAYEGSWLGADIFVSLDKKAVKLMEAHGEAARLLA